MLLGGKKGEKEKNIAVGVLNVDNAVLIGLL